LLYDLLIIDTIQIRVEFEIHGYLLVGDLHKRLNFAAGESSFILAFCCDDFLCDFAGFKSFLTSFLLLGLPCNLL
jgi:hypothetical protein